MDTGFQSLTLDWVIIFLNF